MKDMFLVDISGSKLPNLIYWVSGFELGSSGLRSWPEIKDLFKNHPVLCYLCDIQSNLYNIHSC